MYVYSNELCGYVNLTNIHGGPREISRKGTEPKTFSEVKGGCEKIFQSRTELKRTKYRKSLFTHFQENSAPFATMGARDHILWTKRAQFERM